MEKLGNVLQCHTGRKQQQWDSNLAWIISHLATLSANYRVLQGEGNQAGFKISFAFMWFKFSVAVVPKQKVRSSLAAGERIKRLVDMELFGKHRKRWL